MHDSPISEQPVAAVVLAAGRSTRAGTVNKLLAKIDGRPLVRIVCEETVASRAGPIVVVTGHQGDEVAAALEGLGVEIVENPDYGSGLASSLRTGVGALPKGTGAAIVLLADMPSIMATDIDRLIAAFDPKSGAGIVTATHNGRRGNPVVWSSRYFAELGSVSGDKGGRDLISRYAGSVIGVELGPAAAADLDTPEDLTDAGVTLP